MLQNLEETTQVLLQTGSLNISSHEEYLRQRQSVLQDLEKTLPQIERKGLQEKVAEEVLGFHVSERDLCEVVVETLYETQPKAFSAKAKYDKKTVSTILHEAKKHAANNLRQAKPKDVLDFMPPEESFNIGGVHVINTLGYVNQQWQHYAAVLRSYIASNTDETFNQLPKQNHILQNGTKHILPPLKLFEKTPKTYLRNTYQRRIALATNIVRKANIHLPKQKPIDKAMQKLVMEKYFYYLL